MPESNSVLQGRLEAAITPGYRERLLDKGLARGLIWRDGNLPDGAPTFPDSLTDDLLDYAYSILALAFRLRSQEYNNPVLEKAFLVSGEAIEAAVHRGDTRRSDRGFNQVCAAISFHLARYAARAYSMLPISIEYENLAPTERILVHLLRRKLDKMHHEVTTWLLDDRNKDSYIAQRLLEDEHFDETDAIHLTITTSFMQALALFDHALITGLESSAIEAQRILGVTASVAGELHAASHWWTSMMAMHLINEIWQDSLYHQVPSLPPEDPDAYKWNFLLHSYIQRLRVGKRSAISLWPSQIPAARRTVDPLDNLVVALPTSAGKTRIAELCILRTLASEHRVIYVTPLRALSAQVEKDLAEAFLPLGFSVSSLYGSAGIINRDAETLREGKIVVSTPEKLDFALRNDPSIINDVGLVVLDEGHMLGPNEREVRYEALVQRLLRRSDSESRRIVCLSALFPTPEEMTDLVGWIRQDVPGMPVHSLWRPTRQRFGTLRWMSGVARLDIRLEGENPFVPRFVEAMAPMKGSKRRKSFPSSKNELTIAGAWRFVNQKKDVLIYCTLRSSVETIGKLILKCINQRVLEPFRQANERIRDVMAIGAEWLGASHPAVECLKYGVALHHGGLPRPYLNEVERLLREGECQIIIASPTLAQGLNLSASVLLVPSIWRNQEIIPPVEFANVVGRAGRAFVDVEGLVLHIVWEKDRGRGDWAVRQWEDFVSRAKAPAVSSGLLQLAAKLFQRIGSVASVPIDEVVEYVTGHGYAWDFSDMAKATTGLNVMEWERDIASLDAAIMSLLDIDAAENSLDTELDKVLEGSLFSRQLSHQEERIQNLLMGFLVARASRIWNQTTSSQRKGYHVAGIGLSTGQFLDANIDHLIELLLRADSAMADGNSTSTADIIVDFAGIVFGTAPFKTSDIMQINWEDALRSWIKGCPVSEVIILGGNYGVDLIQDSFTYRLPWAMEAVRVYALAIGKEGADQIQGLATLAVEVGNTNRSVITLLLSGLISREAAVAVVDTTGASFIDNISMEIWLKTEKVQLLCNQKDWPTPRSRNAWLKFYEEHKKGIMHVWNRETQIAKVLWSNTVPDIDSYVVIEPENNGSSYGIVLTPNMVKLGVLNTNLRRPYSDIVSARVGKDLETITIEYFGVRF